MDEIGSVGRMRKGADKRPAKEGGHVSGDDTPKEPRNGEKPNGVHLEGETGVGSAEERWRTPQ